MRRGRPSPHSLPQKRGPRRESVAVGARVDSTLCRLRKLVEGAGGPTSVVEPSSPGAYPSEQRWGRQLGEHRCGICCIPFAWSTWRWATSCRPILGAAGHRLRRAAAASLSSHPKAEHRHTRTRHRMTRSWTLALSLGSSAGRSRYGTGEWFTLNGARTPLVRAAARPYAACAAPPRRCPPRCPCPGWS